MQLRKRAFNKPVLVLGAGIAGIAASHALVNQGIPVRLLEARSRIGGRIHDISTEEGATLGLGPMFLHGLGTVNDPNPLKSFLDELHISYQAFKITDSLLAIGKDKITDLKKRQIIFHRFMKTLLKIQTNPASVIAKDPVIRNENAEIAEHLAYAYEEAECASDLKNVGPLEWTHHHHVHEGHDLILPEAGFSKVVNILYQEAMNTGLLTLTLNAEVKKITHTTQEIGCEYVDAGKLEKLQGFAAIISALPLGVLQSEDVNFDPVLSLEKRKALAHLEPGSMKKIALEFEQCFWDNVPFISILDEVKNPALYLFINMHYFSYTKTNTLLAFFHRDPLCERDNEEDLIEAALQRLRKLYPNQEKNISLKKTTFCDWRKDIFTKGAWCSYGPHMMPADIEYLKMPEENHLFFAGEHTGVSTVDSAYTSGLRAAKEVLLALK